MKQPKKESLPRVRLPKLYDKNGTQLTRDETIWILGYRLLRKRGELPAFLDKVNSIIEDKK